MSVQAVRFFEQDHIPLWHVCPAIKTFKRHLEQQEDPFLELVPESHQLRLQYEAP
jgi:hypothetical protein